MKTNKVLGFLGIVFLSAAAGSAIDHFSGVKLLTEVGVLTGGTYKIAYMLLGAIIAGATKKLMSS